MQSGSTSELVLPWWAGLIGGIVLAPVGGSCAALLAEPATAQLMDVAGNVQIFCAVGAVLGLLHAVSQVRIPFASLLGVGAFYGVFLWALSALTTWLAGSALRAVVHSFPWFAGCVTFGAGLGLLAALAGLLRPQESTTVLAH